MPWLQDVAMALAYLHEKGIAHMDIKANNVLISDDNRTVVTDLGSSTLKRHSTR